MNRERINELLLKYYDGISSPQEEQELKEWFTGDGDFTGYEGEVEIFSHYCRSVSVAVPAPDFEQRLISAIDNIENVEKKRHSRQVYTTLFSAAATLLILISSWFLFNREKEPLDTFSDPRLAYAETIKILSEVSVKLNHGTQALREISRIQSKAQLSIESFDRSVSIVSGKLKRSGLFNTKATMDSDSNINNK
jgi:hypothetical protein